MIGSTGSASTGGLFRVQKLSKLCCNGWFTQLQYDWHLISNAMLGRHR